MEFYASTSCTLTLSLSLSLSRPRELRSRISTIYNCAVWQLLALHPMHSMWRSYYAILAGYRLARLILTISGEELSETIESRGNFRGKRGKAINRKGVPFNCSRNQVLRCRSVAAISHERDESCRNSNGIFISAFSRLLFFRLPRFFFFLLFFFLL